MAMFQTCGSLPENVIRFASDGAFFAIFTRVLEQDVGLFLLGPRGVDLGTRLVVGRHAVQADAAGERGLAVPLTLFDVGAPEPPRAVGALPPEDDSRR